jgi:CAAX protease family protein
VTAGGSGTRRRPPYTAAVTNSLSLAVLLLSWDFLIYLVPIPVIVFANLAESYRPTAPAWRTATTITLLSIGGLALVYSGVLVTTPGELANGLTVFAAGALSLLTVWPPFRVVLARVLPIDPASLLDATAIVFTLVMVGTQIGAQLSEHVLASLATQQSLHPLDLVIQDLPFVLAALLGVGLLIRRQPLEVLGRLGIVRPEWWQPVLALACAGAFYAFSTGTDALASRLTPDLAKQVAAANQQIFGLLGNPIGIATIALTAGLAEEMLFRGALQPRLGLVWTALVFAAIHSQYGLSLDALAVFILAVGLGLLRRFANTTTTIVCHVAYNAVVGIGLADVAPLPILLAVEGLLIATLAVALVTRRRAPDPELRPL